ncbi:MAG: winged helix-turn-helix transcriptional regulator [Candidatus Micrarchaeia archaeon]
MSEKISRFKFDAIDLKLLYELDCNAFQSLSKIAKKLKTKRDVLLYRIKRMEKEGIIKGYIALIDYGKIGFMAGVIYLKYQHENDKIKNEILDYFNSEPKIWWVNSRDGNFDLGAGFWFRNLKEFRKAQIEMMKKYLFYFKEMKSRIYTHILQFPRRYLSKNFQDLPPVSISTEADKMTDDTDDRILSILSKNARMPYTEIATIANLSAAQVHYRIKNMKKNRVILGARPMIDRSMLGYRWYKVDFYLDDCSIMDKLKAYLLSHLNTVYVYEAVGGADIEVEFEVKNPEELSKIIGQIKNKFQNAIRYTEFYEFTKEHKLIYFPQASHFSQ